MEIAQKRQWAEAQQIVLSFDTLDAAKRHLRFLAAVDETAHLYDGPALRKAIYRYNAYWLPLLAQLSETPLYGKPLVVPLDCEWIWHCHRLNPVRYISDCKELFGRLLDNRDVVSSVEGYPIKQTEEIWSKMFPQEPYELDFSKVIVDDAPLKSMENHKFTDYDLVSAVQRQSSFYWQVSRPHFSNDIFLQESIARYKAFLYLMKKNMGTQACVPTYDIDLIWHTHQLHSVSYSKDLIQLFGKVAEHDDTDSDRSEGNKLNVSFKETTQQWEEAFGKSYWRAGAMYRGSPPTHNQCDEKQKPIKGELIEMLVEFTGIKFIPESINREDLFVTLSKKQPDMFLNNKDGRDLSIQSISGKKERVLFWCEPNGELVFELKSQKTSSIDKDSKVLGFSSLSLNELLDPISELYVKKWIELTPPTLECAITSKPIFLQISISFTVPTPAMNQMLGVVAAGGCSGKCSGGCKGLPEVAASGCSGKCSGTCNGIFTVSAGGCSGKCSGTCNGIFTVSAGGCSGKCSGTCNGIFTVSAGGCSGKCSGTCNGIFTVSAGGCSGKCSGTCNGIFTASASQPTIAAGVCL